jgi:tripartite ATP-independent transporter DctM subunit
MSSEAMAALMFPALFALVFLGIPISFALLTTAFVFGLALFGDNIGLQLYNSLLQTATQFVLSAIPPFVFMGTLLERSGIAERLFLALQLWMSRLRGGLALATMTMAGIFAASTGIVGAVEVVIGMMAIPVMMKFNYDKSLISGTITAGGSLGTMIPPSIVVVIYGSVAQVSVGQLIAAVLFPGLLMVGLFLAYIYIRCLIRPADGPAVRTQDVDLRLSQKLWITLTALVPAAFLIVAVLGSIIFGIASPTEAASVGALGATILTLAYRRFTWSMLAAAFRQTLLINCMILLIVAGGTMFASVFRVYGGHGLVTKIVAFLDLSTMGTISLFLLIVFLAGFILDWVSIILICLPIFAPLVKSMGVNEIWFAVLMVVAIQTSYLTPPMAPAIFYLRSIAPPEIRYSHMYRGVVPFVVCQILVILAVALFPTMATYLPSRMLAF